MVDINPNIIMGAQQPNTGAVINAANDRQMNNAMQTEQILRQHYDNLDAREKSRLTSTVIGASHLKSFLDANDVDGAKQFLQQRKQQLNTRMAHGENIDTQETDYALQALEGGQIDQLKNEVNGILAAGQVYGLVNPAAGVGGETGVLVNRLIKEGSAKDVNQALQLIKGGAGQTGKNIANIGTGREANYETQTGSNVSDLQYKPQIARESARTGVVGARQGENEANFTDFKAAVPGLEKVVNNLYTVADRATYSLSNQATDAFQRQLGFNPGDDAAARTYYENLVRNEILPLLKPTFGAQFTIKEGEWLLATLGDVNLSPQEKKAALQARVDSWKNLADTMAARAGQPPIEGAFSSFPPGGAAQLPQGAQLIGTQGGKKVYQLPDGSGLVEE